MARLLPYQKLLKKRHIGPHEIYDPDIHIADPRVRADRRKPWIRTDQNDRRSGKERRKGVAAAHVFEVVE